MPKRGKSSPEGKSLNVYNIVKILIIIAIVIYIVGIVPTFTNAISTVFSNPLFKIGFLVFVLCVGYKDLTVGALLAIAFIVTYLSSSYNVLGNVRTGAGQLVGGVGSGAQQVVGSLGGGAQQLLGGASQLVGGIGSGAQQVLGGAGKVFGGIGGGIGSGAQQALGGAGQVVGGISGGAQQLLSGAQQLIGGVSSGAQSVLRGVGYGTQNVIGGAQSGTQSIIGGAQSGTQNVIGGVGSGAQSLLGNNNGVGGFMDSGYENMENQPGMSVSQAYQQHMLQENNGDKGCSVQPAMMTGCDPVVGYNSPYNCGGNCGGLDPACLCSGVSVFKDELNAQGLNFPIGYSGCQVGSTF